MWWNFALSSIGLLKRSNEIKYKKILDKLSPETNVNYYFKPLQKSLYNYIEDINFLIFNVIEDFKVDCYILEGQDLYYDSILTIFTNDSVITTTFLLRVPMVCIIALELCS